MECIHHWQGTDPWGRPRATCPHADAIRCAASSWQGIDQTRGWFYTLMVLSTALFDKPAFKNLICNGLVLAEDGRKMSKRLKNYPDPAHILGSYGADALRLYLINSPVVRADDLAFKERGVMQVLKDVFLPWYHAYRLFVQSANALELTPGGTPFARDAKLALSSTNVMDKWILASSNSLERRWLSSCSLRI